MTPSPDIVLHVNGEERAFESSTTIARYLVSLGLGERRVAVMLNGDVVPRAEYDSRQLSDGDVVELITLAGGG